MRHCFLLALALLSISALNAQGTGRGNSQAQGIFPVTLVLEVADYAVSEDGALRSVWRPDWPSLLPVDSFKVLSGKVSRIVVEGEGVSLELSFTQDGLLEEFPFMLDGRMAQVGFVYNEFSETKEINIAFPLWDSLDSPIQTSPIEEPWKLEFLEYRNALPEVTLHSLSLARRRFPYIVRASRSDAWYFIYFSGTTDEILETWYDVDGNFIDAFAFSLIEIGNKKRIGAMRDYRDSGNNAVFYYDSRGLLTEASGSVNLGKVLYYREDLPRYWECRPVGEQEGMTVQFAFQYDEAGIIPRVTGYSGGDPFDYRFEYAVDERGNWIERRVIQMFYQQGILQPGLLQTGLLAPWPGLLYTRILEYRE